MNKKMKSHLGSFYLFIIDRSKAGVDVNLISRSEWRGWGLGSCLPPADVFLCSGVIAAVS